LLTNDDKFGEDQDDFTYKITPVKVDGLWELGIFWLQQGKKLKLWPTSPFAKDFKSPRKINQ